MRYEVVRLGDGWNGTNTTVEWASKLVEESLTDPVVVLQAQDIVRPVMERDKAGHIRAIDRWVRAHVKYLNEGIETIKTPRFLIDEIREKGVGLGDCDDFVILLAALYKAVGLRVRFKVISQRKDGAANHIYMEVFHPTRGWITNDAIVKDKPLGWEIPAKQRTVTAVYPLDGLGGTMATRDFWSGGVVDNGVPFLPEEPLKYSMQMVDPGVVKRGGMLEVAEDGTVCGLGDGIFDTVSSLIGAGTKLAIAKVQSRLDKQLAPKTPPPQPARGFSFSLSNPVVQIGGLALLGFIGWRIFRS